MLPFASKIHELCPDVTGVVSVEHYLINVKVLFQINKGGGGRLGVEIHRSISELSKSVPPTC